MNKNLYRIIFNKHRGQLMAVSETATAMGKAASGEGVAIGAATSAGVVGNLVATLRPLCLSVLASLGMMMFTMGSASAQVIADPNAPGNQRPTVLQTTNGLPQINIQTPSAAGVSRNTYRQFDIQSNGAILNNARTNTQTQLGGWLQGNPWLATGSARIILNEVNSANPSQLRGYIEVAGQRAEVIIANPAGVNADGAGFINASRVTITTGTPQISGGNLEGYLVQRGTVTINGKGLDATLTDYTGILARAVQINAGIWAKDLNIVTGTNQINVEHTTHAATAGTGAAPMFALDVAQLGGMYAGKITLIGTESGVGVRNAGVIGASAGDVVLQSDGWLTNSGSIQATGAGNTQISTAGDVTNSGTIYATGNTGIKARGNISISGLVAAQNHATVVANGATSRIDATSGAVLASGLNTDGTLRTMGDLQVEAPSSVALHGKTASAGNTNIAGSQIDLSNANVSGTQLMLTATNGDLNAAHAIVTAQEIVTAQTPQMLRTDGAQVTANQINIAAHDLSNIGGQITQSGATNLTIQLPGNLNNSQGRIATNSQNLTLNATTLTNTDGKIEHAGTGSLNIGATAFDGQRGISSSNGALNLNAANVNTDSATTTANQVTINANTLSNRSGHISQTGAGQTTIVAGQQLDNTAGKIETNGSATISTATLVNTQGRVAAATSASITASNGADNTDGIITAAQNVVLSGGNVSNTRGEIQAVRGNATITVADLSNAGNIYAGANLATTAANINNSGNLYAVGNQTLNASATINNTGVVAAQGDNTISANSLNSGATSLIGAGIKADGTLSTAGSLNVTATRGLTANGQNLAAGNAMLNGAWVNVSSSQTSATNIAVTATDGNVTTDLATVTTPGALSVTANAQNTQTLSNAQGVLSAGQLNAHVANLHNAQGNIVQTGTGDTAIILTSPSSTFDNSAGRIATNGQNLTIDANTFTDTDGKIEHAGTGTLAITAVTLNDQRGQITGNGALTIAAGNIDHRNARTTAQQVTIAATNFDNRQGEISQLGSGDTSITASQTLDNGQGRIQTNGAMSVGATTLLNAQGRITAGQRANVSASSSLNNTDGAIITNSDLTLNAGDVDNTRGSLQAVTGNALLQLSNLNNSTGSIYAGGQLDTSAANVTNTGNLYAAGAQTLKVTGAINNTGVIAAQGDNTITANSLTSSATSLLGAGIKADGALANAGNLSITTAQGLAAHGQNLVAGNAILSGSSVDLSSSQTGAANIAVTATSGQVVTNNATVATSGTLAITASAQNTQSWTNSQGIVSAKQLDVQVANLNNTLGEIVQTGTGDTAINLTSPAGALDNTSGRIAANSNNLTLNGQTLTNIDGKIEHAGSGTLAINAGNLNDQQGQITSNGALNLIAGNIDHRSASTIAQQVTITASNLDSRQGEITQLGAGLTSIAVSQNLDNRAGTIASNGNTNISAQTLNNAGGNLRASGPSNLSITTTAALDNSGAGHIAAGGNAHLVSDAIVNQQGEITAGGTLLATVTQGVQNTQGLIAADGNATLTAATLDNTRGTVASVRQPECHHRKRHE
jgi:filamentous hemagglutinin